MSVLCFGEILWDFLPDGLFPGGAPFNVAYHLHALGAQPQVVSAVGADLLGDELLRRLRAWGIDTGGIVRRHGLPTGYVRATVSTRGDATYEIVPSVAWDQIELTADTLFTATRARAIVFGSLAQRAPVNRAALSRLLALLPPDALRVFDVNLRPPHDDLDVVRQLAAQSTLLKLNSAEAARLAANLAGGNGGSSPPLPAGSTSAPAGAPGSEEEAHARILAARSGAAMVCITGGERGAGLLQDGAWHWEEGRPVEVVDTVGAGDSFLACLVTHLLRGGLSPRELLARACRTGEWVASQRGATPPYPAEGAPPATTDQPHPDHS